MKTQNQLLREERINEAIVNDLVEKNLRNKYSQTLKEQYNIERTEAKQTPIFNIKNAMKYAAVFVVLAGALIVFQQNATNDINTAQAYIKSTSLLGDQSVQRKDDSYNDQLRLDANYSFINGDYDAAIQNFEKLIFAKSSTEADLFYLSISYLRAKNQNATKAIERLTGLATSSTYQSEAKWFLGLAYVINGQDAKAKTTFENIIHSNDTYAKDAKVMLDKLR